jgi:hypothetical protein
MGAGAMAGVLYFLGVFAVGTLLGTVRVFALEPAMGMTAAVALELPVMIGVCWFSSRALIDWCAVDRRLMPRVAMGVVALVLLLAAEAVLSTLYVGRTLSEHIALYQRPATLMGLGAQVLMGLFPLADLAVAAEDGPGSSIVGGEDQPFGRAMSRQRRTETTQNLKETRSP